MKKKGVGLFVSSVSIFNVAAIIALIVMMFHLTMEIKMIKQGQKANETENSINSVSYACDAGKTIQAVYFDDKVELNLSDGRSWLLMQGMSASGTRFTNDNESFTFWIKGNTAFIEEGVNEILTYNNCNQTPAQ